MSENIDAEMPVQTGSENNVDMKSIDVEELATSTQNMSVEQEHALKPKKHRRGKKKRQRSRSETGSNPSYDPTDPEFARYLIIDSDNNDEQQPQEGSQTKRDSSYVLIRPVDVPKAPMNSTQFIIDGHEDCGLYLSFEKPHAPKDSRSVEEIQHSPSHYKAAYEDIDYVYECEDWEDSSFCRQDFEDVYYKARFDDLIELEKEQLLAMYTKLESQACNLQEELSQCDPMYKLNTLQEQLLKLQEENVALKSEHRKLKRRTRTNSHSATSSLEDHHESSSSEEDATLQEDLSSKHSESTHNF